MKKYRIIVPIVVVLLMIGFYMLGSSNSQNGSGNQDHSSTSESNTYESSPSSFQSHNSKEISGQMDQSSTTSQMPNTSKVAGKEQQMVYQADLHMQVTKLPEAQKELDEVAKQHKASMVSSSDSQNLDERVIRITYNVPQTQFQTFIDHSKKISENTPEIQIQGEDVSEELVDLTARIKAKRAMETRLIVMMNKATTTNDLLAIEQTLGNVQTELEQLTGRQQYLQHRVAFSTVTIEISSSTYQPLQTKYSFINQLSQGFLQSCKNLWTGLQLFVIWLAKALPFLILIVVVAIPAILYFKKRQKK
ncbi:DUF4349 domain-containing protein [Shimazuella kribbensis]|uniref:DUF4349 domain-containing protein n=1 Tax=Shimazuella kribbensis TaxID=139808 RepID=UPI001FDF63F7|nr:DUF4349 domain-containing protein [Shimazuella kribbensis]